MPDQLILKNARIVTPTEIVEGSVLVRDGRIAGLHAGPTEVANAIDFEGDYLIPGLVDIHTDNLERHMRPRNGAEWPILAALLAHDTQMVSAGITTVFDSLYVGSPGISAPGPGALERSSESLKNAIRELAVCRQTGVFRGDHFLHLRTEVTMEDMPENFSSVYPEPAVRLVSLMDHTPGQRQLRDMSTFIARESRESQRTPEAIEEQLKVARQRQQRFAGPNRSKVLSLVNGHSVALASHDDATVEEVEQAHADGITICEFPTTVEAAETARIRGMQIVAGSPNIVLGRSQSGNVAVEELARLGVLDGLASDYVPYSLLHAPFLLSKRLSMPLPDAIAMVGLAPARMVGLDDRGSIEIGKRADLVRVKTAHGLPIARTVWCQGKLA
jgi:alpha-D-ribose 1-methylphosphonate 5-triphosphate diphosphatase